MAVFGHLRRAARVILPDVKVQLKPLSNQVVVITGATSGIGLATARMAAKRGAKLVLAARNEEALQQLAGEITAAGGEALAVPTDVTKKQDVANLADAAVSRFGDFDTWVNDAGGSIYGLIRNVPVEEERKLFELNYWGVVYGARVAADYLRDRGGAIINIGSVASDRSIPLQSAYSASKHAVKAFTDALRVELEKEGAPVSVTLIKPTAIDTPFFRHAKTYMDAQPVEPSPMYAPELVAKAILCAAENPMRDLLVGDKAPLESWMGRFFPALGDKFVKKTMFEGQKSDRRPQPGENRIFQGPSSELRERGGYDEVTTMEHSVYTEAAMRPLLTGAVTMGICAAAVAAVLMGSGKKGWF
jgi:short-subunit dehydrogenase